MSTSKPSSMLAGYLCKAPPKKSISRIGGGGGWKERWFWCDDGMINYTISPKRAPLGSFRCAEISLLYKFDEPSVYFGFSLLTPLREYFLLARTEDEREYWLEGIKERCPNAEIKSISSTVRFFPPAPRASIMFRIERSSNRIRGSRISSLDEFDATTHTPTSSEKEADTAPSSAATLPAKNPSSWNKPSRPPPMRPKSSMSSKSILKTPPVPPQRPAHPNSGHGSRHSDQGTRRANSSLQAKEKVLESHAKERENFKEKPGFQSSASQAGKLSTGARTRTPPNKPRPPLPPCPVASKPSSDPPPRPQRPERPQRSGESLSETPFLTRSVSSGALRKQIASDHRPRRAISPLPPLRVTHDGLYENRPAVALDSLVESPKESSFQIDKDLHERRTRIVRELVETEKNYVDILKSMKICFRERLFQFITEIENEKTKNTVRMASVKRIQAIKTVGKSKVKLNRESVARMFVNLDSILELHDGIIYAELKKKMNDWSTTQIVGDIFKKVAPWMKIYNEYSNNYEQIVDVFTKLMERSIFAEWIEKCAEESKTMCGITDLENLLITPIQRIPRYTLLLGDLLSKTPKDHPDAKLLEACTKELSSVADYLDQNNKIVENSQRMLKIGSKVGKNVAPDLLISHRKLLLEKTIMCSCASLITAKEAPFVGLKKMHFVLFNDILAHVPESKGVSMVGDSKNHWPNNLIWIQDISLQDAPKFPFALEVIGPQIQYFLRFKTEEEKDEWYHALHQAIDAQLLKVSETNDPVKQTDRREGFFQYPSGEKYTGCWDRGIRVGRGKSNYHGEKYEGMFFNDIRSGKGKLSYVTGEIFEGNFVNGRPYGQGKQTFPDQSIYEGEWKSGMRNGNGTLHYGNGDMYKGVWEANVPHGKGRFLSKQRGSTFVGHFVHGLAHGEGVLRCEDGKSYEGSFAFGLPEGKGVMDYGNGAMYEGEWSGGLRSGRGTMTFTYTQPNASTDLDTEIYEGQWQYNQRDGIGTQTFIDGSEYHGEWKRGSFHGHGKMKYPLGIIAFYEGEWVCGRKHGKGQLLYKSGKRFTGIFRNDLIHGTGQVIYPDGSVFDGKWVNGVPTGKCGFHVCLPHKNDLLQKVGSNISYMSVSEDRNHPAVEFSLGLPHIQVSLQSWW